MKYRAGTELWYRLLKQCAWNAFFHIFTTIQRLVWLLNGTHWTIANSHLPRNYQRSAQVLKVIGRHRIHNTCHVCQPSEFLTTHECFDSPERVLQDHPSLYKLTDDKAIFVEALPGSELWRSGYSPFFTDAQFRHAVRLIRMPIQSFHRLAVQLQDPENVTFIGIIGCRGSTLLTQMFEHTGQVVAISEPPALEYLEEKAVSGEEFVDTKLFISAVRLLCKPTSARSEKGHVIKIPFLHIHVMPVLARCFHKAHWCFMYRDGLKVAQSRYRIWTVLPQYSIHKASGGIVCIYWLLVKLLGLHINDYPSQQTLGSLAAQAKKWAEAMDYYRKLRETGLPIVGIRYDDLVAEPESNMRRILGHCALPEHTARNSIQALNVDSQRGTPVSRESLQSIVVPQYTDPQTRTELDAICKRYSLPPFSAGPCLAPGTITTAAPLQHHSNCI